MEKLIDYLSQTYFGNTLVQYLYFFLIIIGFAILAKAIYYTFKHKISKLTNKTDTKLDNMIIDFIEEPISLILVVVGFWVAFKTLNLSEEFEKFISQVLTIIFLLIVTWLVVRLVDVVVKGFLSPLVAKSESKLDDQVIPVISNLAKIAIWIMVIIVLLSELGYDVLSLVTGLGLGGVAIAMAAKDTIGHMFGGFNIFMNKPFQIDDVVLFKGTEGTIEEVGLRMSSLRTWDDTKVFIPNSEIANSVLENISARKAKRVVSNIHVAVDVNAASIEKATDTIIKTVKSIDGITENVRCDFYDYLDFSLIFRLEYWIELDKDYFRMRNKVNTETKKVLEKMKIRLSHPPGAKA
ncbi:MAG: mechanosensitive ion channel family protein [Deltaproteobacteria bacterium]|uniref:Mechanosensitive ion channel family protein n=1 Tax=Candidatus Zymogenus saltonus TaxID=2844893 RepID=A0A9D8PR93_9DELT|nr:mechanosensitive ion channel family protein [Candidatus Zymogenus saltonus]